MNGRLIVLSGLLWTLTGCTGLLQSRAPAPDVYVLTSKTLPNVAPMREAVLWVAKPTARAGLDSDHLVLTLADRRSDVYASARWAAPLPQMVEGLLLDALRSSGAISAVVSERSAFRGRYLLQTDITAFTADYSDGSARPTVRVTVRGTLGIPGERRLLATVSGTGAVMASVDRRGEVVAAYQAAWDAAANELVTAVSAAIERAERP